MGGNDGRGRWRVTQTPDERIEALRSLLPFIEVHLDYRGEADGEGEGCDSQCHGCIKRCTRAPEVLYRQLRGRYPIIHDIEALLPELSYRHLPWALGLYYCLVQPWDGFDRTRREEWCEAALAWLSEELATATLGLTRPWREIPTYVPDLELDRHKRQPADPEKARDAHIIQLRIDGASYHRIASTVRCSKSTVQAVLAAQTVRQGRTT